jgi:hypothetical protein
LEWSEFAERLEVLLRPFLIRFEAILADAPAADKDYAQLLVDHEAALIDFCKAEAIGSDGLVHINNFDTRHQNLLQAANQKTSS